MPYRSIIFAFFLLAALFFHSDAKADIIKYIDSNGTIHFTDSKTSRPHVVYKKTKKIASVKRNRTPAKAKPYLPLIRQAGNEHGVDPKLIKSVIQVESDFNSRAISRAGAQGLMQLMPPTAAKYKVKNVYSPNDNIDGGTKHLKYLLDKYNGNITLTLAAYNAGEKAVARYSGVPPYGETRRYVEKVLNLYGKKFSAKSYRLAKPKIFRYIDENGTLFITDMPSPSAKRY